MGGMKSPAIKPHTLYWAFFNRFAMRLPGQCVIDCSHSGSCDAAVAHWAPKIAQQCDEDNFKNRPTSDKIRAELREQGAWSDDGLADDAENWLRIVWIAACNIAEDDEPNC